jgi:hypothetical protein
MAISRLAAINPISNSDILMYTGLRATLVSIIATNKSLNDGTIRVWVVPLDQDSFPGNFSYISYDVSLKSNDSLETFRFPILIGDKVYVRSSIADISFSLSGVDDTNIPGIELADLQEEIQLAKVLALLDI